MKSELITTPTSRYIAEAINERMNKLGCKPADLERLLDGKCHYHTARRIRQGSSGIALRHYEDVLDALGLRIMIVPKTHKDVIDLDNVVRQYLRETKTLKIETRENIHFAADNGCGE